MIDEDFFASKKASTFVALEWLLAFRKMRNDVTLEMSLAFESLSAIVALKFSDVQVSDFVCIEAAFEFSYLFFLISICSIITRRSEFIF